MFNDPSQPGAPPQQQQYSQQQGAPQHPYSGQPGYSQQQYSQQQQGAPQQFSQQQQYPSGGGYSQQQGAPQQYSQQQPGAPQQYSQQPYDQQQYGYSQQQDSYGDQFSSTPQQFSQNTHQKDGVRWNFNILPSTKADARECILPISCIYTPLHQDSENEAPALQYNPVVCRQCRTILNPFCKVDFRSKIWICPFCLTRNQFPVSYSGITEQNRPAELYSEYTTVEYVLQQPQEEKLRPIFIYVIDTCLENDELEHLREALLTSLDLIPEDSLVGFMTFGTTVQLFEIGFTECSKAYVFRGDVSPTLQTFQDELGLPVTPAQSGQGAQQINPQVLKETRKNIMSRFLLPLSEVEMTLTNIIEELQTDPWPVKPQQRARRATGVALSVAVSLLESSFPQQGARIMQFIGGPCTYGDGVVADLDFKKQMRMHNDLSKNTAPHFKKALKYYQSLTERLVKNGHCVDIWAANLDQVGILEMKSCCENTGGTIVLTDTFKNPVFQQSLTKFFERDNDDQLKFAFNGTLEIQTSQDVRICGALGPVTSMNQKHRCVSDQEIGYGRTNSWKVNSLDLSTSISVYFDLVPTAGQTGQGGRDPMDPQSNVRFFQFVTSYQHSNGQRRLRVSTVGLRVAPAQSFGEIGAGFDQETGAVCLARHAVFKAESEYLFDVLRWLDQSLIRFIARFGNFQKGNPQSLSLPPNIQIFPQFLYHLRRSPFLRVFNFSPDETTFYRLHLNRVNTDNGIMMIQPALFQYSFQNPNVATPVLLDADQVRKDCVLLMDTYFLVLIYNGEKVAYWKSQNYQEDPQYANLKQMLEQPVIDAKAILKDRFPYPRYIISDEGESQARHLLAKINPSQTHANTGPYGAQAQDTVQVMSDDASLGVFLNQLQVLVSQEGDKK